MFSVLRIELVLNLVIAVLGLVLPALFTLYEVGFRSRKRLGYRVQMDQAATEGGSSSKSHLGGVLTRLQGDDGEDLVDPTLVLLRIENIGRATIDKDDYYFPESDEFGLYVDFPGRRVVGVTITELSAERLRPWFKEGPGYGNDGSRIRLPRVPLNRYDHYKVLAALESTEGTPSKAFERPKVNGGLKGVLRNNGEIEGTTSRSGAPRWVVPLSGFLVLVVVAQLLISLLLPGDGPIDCSTGRIRLVGSTAFAPVLREAADMYAETCPDADFDLALMGSVEGLRATTGGDIVGFSDGTKPDTGYPRLVPRPIALFLFTLVVNQEAGVEDLSLKDIRRIYAGQVRNWKELGGNDVPVVVVSRDEDSGTRTSFLRRVLNGKPEAAFASVANDCTQAEPQAVTKVVGCQRRSTGELLTTVAQRSGAIGYAELGAADQAAKSGDLNKVRIGQYEATLENAEQGVYPYVETEYAYTEGPPEPDGLAASFIRYLTNLVGQDIIRQHGSLPCADLSNPASCSPQPNQ